MKLSDLFSDELIELELFCDIITRIKNLELPLQFSQIILVVTFCLSKERWNITNNKQIIQKNTHLAFTSRFVMRRWLLHLRISKHVFGRAGIVPQLRRH